MSNYNDVPDGKDPVIWNQAKRRAGFKVHALVYLLVNLFLWASWYFSGTDFVQSEGIIRHKPWPLFTTLGWGLGLAFHFASAYLFPNFNSVEKEYEQLISKK
ncbi:MAG: 2TM domain-containing protein [Ferruginibacter sp.]